MAEESSLLVSEEGGQVELTLNRPERKNALDRPLVRRLGEALRSAIEREATRVIVISGAGGSFCSGADLASMGPDDLQGDLGERIDEFQDLVRAVVEARQPVVASIDGPAVGFGADLALACDVRVMSRRGYLQESFAAIGLMNDGGGTFSLPALIGPGLALEYLMLGTRLTAERCHELGLANHVVSDDALVGTTRELARKLEGAAPLALARIKRSVRAGLREGLDGALARERAGQQELLRSQDLMEGVAAFLGKRLPHFRGH